MGTFMFSSILYFPAIAKWVVQWTLRRDFEPIRPVTPFEDTAIISPPTQLTLRKPNEPSYAPLEASELRDYLNGSTSTPMMQSPSSEEWRQKWEESLRSKYGISNPMAPDEQGDTYD